MFSKIIIVTLFLCSVHCDLHKNEGDECEWDGVKGVCVTEHRCFTSLDEKSPKQPICNTKGQEKIICCTDCELVNDTRTFVYLSSGQFHWKTGQKAHDNCLEYYKTLQYECEGTNYFGVKRVLNDTKNCHKFSKWGIGGAPPPTTITNRYAYLVHLGYGEDLEQVKYVCGGSIISDRYVLTVAHCALRSDPPKYIAYRDLYNTAQELQHVAIKRVIAHPDYKAPVKYNDIALLELETPLIFSNTVLPACLPVADDLANDVAKVTTWSDPDKESRRVTNTPRTIEVKRQDKDTCIDKIGSNRHLRRGFDDVTMLCYGDTDHPDISCKSFSGEPLLVPTYDSHCANTVIGLAAFGFPCRSNKGFDVYTKVLPYVPWIESVVWP